MKNEKQNLVRPFGLPESVSKPVVTPLSPSVVYSSQSPDMLDHQYELALRNYTNAPEAHPNAHPLSKQNHTIEHLKLV